MDPGARCLRSSSAICARTVRRTFPPMIRETSPRCTLARLADVQIYTSRLGTRRGIEAARPHRSRREIIFCPRACADYDSGTLYLNNVPVSFSVTNNFLAVARKFLRPRLAARQSSGSHRCARRKREAHAAQAACFQITLSAYADCDLDRPYYCISRGWFSSLPS